jgi:hypothetical protein
MTWLAKRRPLPADCNKLNYHRHLKRRRFKKSHGSSDRSAPRRPHAQSQAWTKVQIGDKQPTIPAFEGMPYSECLPLSGRTRSSRIEYFAWVHAAKKIKGLLEHAHQLGGAMKLMASGTQ